MNKYSGWQALYMSFFSGDLYRDVAENWKGVGYQYLVLLLAGFSLASAIAIQMFLVRIVEHDIMPNWGTMTISKGSLTMDKPSPSEIDIVTIDPKLCIAYDSSDDAAMPAGKWGWLLTKTALIQVDQTGLTRPLGNFAQFSDNEIVVDKEKLEVGDALLKQWTAVIVFFSFWFVMTIFCMVQTVIYGAIGLIISNVMQVGLSFGQLVRIATVALTPVLLIDLIQRVTFHPVMFYGIISFFIAIGYIAFGVRSNLKT